MSSTLYWTWFSLFVGVVVHCNEGNTSSNDLLAVFHTFICCIVIIVCPNINLDLPSIVIIFLFVNIQDFGCYSDFQFCSQNIIFQKFLSCTWCHHGVSPISVV